MKKTVLIFLSAILSIALYAQEPQDPILSVLDFEVSGISAGEQRVFNDYLTAAIVETGTYRVIDRMQRENILKEIEFSYSGCTDEGCQIEIGKLLSANRIVVGSLGKIGESFLLNIKLVDVETGETLAVVSEKYGDLDLLLDDTERLARKFVTGDDTAPAAPEGRPGERGSSIEITIGYGFPFEYGITEWVRHVGVDGTAEYDPWHQLPFPNEDVTVEAVTSSFITKLGYVFPINTVFALGGWFAYEGEHIKVTCNEYPGDGTYTYPLHLFGGGLKVIFGNRMDAFALAISPGLMYQSYLPVFFQLGVTAYYRAFFVEMYFSGDSGSDDQLLNGQVNLSVGYSIDLRSERVQNLFNP